MRPGAISVLLVALAFVRQVGAQPPSPRGPAEDSVRVPSEAPPSESEAHGEARAHFERALSEYRAGRYRRAVAELEAALAKDPSGKDLVFNLALVHEKLGELDRAIAYLERFVGMEDDPEERARAEQAILRLRGAEQEVLRSQTAKKDAPKPAAPRMEPMRYGRFDAWVAGAAGVAAVSVIVGVVFAVRAFEQGESWSEEAARPGATLDDIGERADRAQNSALLANVAFSVGIAAGAGALALYFGRPERSKSGPARALARAAEEQTASPSGRGWWVGLGSEWIVGAVGSF